MWLTPRTRRSLGPMYDNVRHRGAWLPADARHDAEASTRMAQWVRANVPNLDQRVIVTPNARDAVDKPPVLKALAHGAPRMNGSGRGADDWLWCSGPVVLAWPSDRTLEQCVPMATDQTLIVFEWANSLLGWATATEAFNAATGEQTPPLAEDLHKEFERMLSWDNELNGGAYKGPGRDRPQKHLRTLHDAGLDEDFVTTYALALNEGIDAKQIRAHYGAAAGRPPSRR